MKRLGKIKIISLLAALLLIMSAVYTPSAGAERFETTVGAFRQSERSEGASAYSDGAREEGDSSPVGLGTADVVLPTENSAFIGEATMPVFETESRGEYDVSRSTPWQYNYTDESWADYEAALASAQTAEERAAAFALLAPRGTASVTGSFFRNWTTADVNAVVSANSGRLCDSIGDGLNTGSAYNNGDFSRNTAFTAGDGWFAMTATADFSSKAMGWKNMDRSRTLQPDKDGAFPYLNVAGLSEAEGIRFKLEANKSVERILIGLSNVSKFVREQYALKLKPEYVGSDGYINIPFSYFEKAFWGSSFSQSELEDVIVFIIEAYGAAEGTTVKVSDMRGYITAAPVTPPEPHEPGFIEPEASEYVGSHFRATDFRIIKFDEMFPEGFTGDTSWDPMGIDGNGIIYFGYTGRRTDLIAGEEIEDFAVFSYDPEKDVVKFLGTFIEACKAANNYIYGEEIPKGHTKFYCVDNKMYMASQGFHDYKQQIDGEDGYETKRGAHLFVYDIEKEILFDLSSQMPGGVWCEHQGVVAMNYMPELGKLVGFTHPLADLVFYDLATGTVDRYVNGIPWSLGNPLSREIIVSGDRVYLYRGVEDTGARAELQWPVYCYDYGEDRLYQTGDTMKGGFWNGQATTSDGKTTYISGCCGILYKMDMETGRVTFLRDMDLDGENVIGYTYSISMSPDETKLFYIPTARNPGRIYEYDIATNTLAVVVDVPTAVYCGSNIVTKDNWYYFTRFGDGSGWEGNPSLVAYKLEPWE